jgi:hypothetical protein
VIERATTDSTELLVLASSTSPTVEQAVAAATCRRRSRVRSELRPNASIAMPPTTNGMALMNPTAVWEKSPLSDLTIAGR